MTEDISQCDRPSYKSSHYLLFGKDSSAVYDHLDCEEAGAYLERQGFSYGTLTQARKGRSRLLGYEASDDPDAHYCDFCGRACASGTFEVLKDGRERCQECSESVVRQREDYLRLFSQTRADLCEKFEIDLPTSVEVKVVSASRLAKMQGKDYVPTKYFDPRAVGLAVDKDGSYSMYFENGVPKLSLIATAAHELTHIWQYSHWNMGLVNEKYGNAYMAVVEGMAKWCEIQYLYLINENDFADRSLANEVIRRDIYGYGLRLYLNQYPLSKSILLQVKTPFMNALPIEM